MSGLENVTQFDKDDLLSHAAGQHQGRELTPSEAEVQPVSLEYTEVLKQDKVVLQDGLEDLALQKSEGMMGLT